MLPFLFIITDLFLVVLDISLVFLRIFLERLAILAFRLCRVISDAALGVCVPSPFDVLGGMGISIVTIPDHCL